MLNPVRYHGFGDFARSVHCAHPPAMATQTLGAGPNASIDAKFTTYPIERVEGDEPAARSTLSVWATIDTAISAINQRGSAHAPRGTDAVSSARPATITTPTYRRAPGGRSTAMDTALAVSIGLELLDRSFPDVLSETPVLIENRPQVLIQV